MGIKSSLFSVLLFLAGGIFAEPSASTVYFLVAEKPGAETHYDSYVIPLDDPADIAHARDLITYGPGIGGTIVSAEITRGANGVNHDYIKNYGWSWHVSDFYGFYDMTAEICDGWPTWVENDLDYWVDPVGQICFWDYTIVAELGDLSVPRYLTIFNGGSGIGTITSVPAGIDCGADCTQVYDDWTEVTLTAVPESGSVFEGWSGSVCSGTGDCAFRMASDISVSAAFSTSPPVANFSGSPTLGNAPMITYFTDLSSGAPISWLWNFGDGETSTEQNPAHVYELEGTYSVSFTATNGAGSDNVNKYGYVATGSCGNLPVQVGGAFYSTLQDAYDHPLTPTGAIIESQAVAFLADIDLWRDIAVTLGGGNNCEYTDQAMGTKINGSLTISNGSVVVENLLIK